MKKYKTCALFGHRKITNQKKVELKLTKKLEELILMGVGCFLVGLNGDFDKIAISILRMLKEKYSKINISIAVSDLSKLTIDKWGYSKLSAYKDFEILSYEIEKVYFKNRITFTNKKMVDQCDMVLCYVDFEKHSSGAKQAVLYAEKNLKTIINIFEKTDDILYGLDASQIEELFKKVFSK